MGYSLTELDDIQAQWGLRFPPDLVNLLRELRVLKPNAFDWIKTAPTEIQRVIDWPYEGFLFDVEHSDLWWPEWGARPITAPERAAVLVQVFARAPRLIPLAGHRYLPEMPCEPGNPVFSVYQSDVICYGIDLADWMVREERGWDHGDAMTRGRSTREILFWSEAVRRNE